MIKGWDKLTAWHSGIAIGFLLILLYGSEESIVGEPNMFALPIFLVFVVSTVYCALQWHVMKLFAKIEKKHPKWK